jgi:hypothetical protein
VRASARWWATRHDYCLNALGWPHQYQYKNGYPSVEDFTTGRH